MKIISINSRIAVILWILFSAMNGKSATIDEAFKTVVYLQHNYVETTTTPDGTFEVWLKLPGTNTFIPKIRSTTGTGFLTCSSNQLYLVTAKHVAMSFNFDGGDMVVMKSNTDKPVVLPLSVLRGNNTNGWIYHEKADVSVLPLSPPNDLVMTILQGHFLPISFLEANTNTPSRYLPLTVIGFPLGEGWGKEAQESFAPLSRRTTACSGFLHEGAVFLLEDPSVQGYSGSPVFYLGDAYSAAGAMVMPPTGQNPECLGIISGTFSDDTGGKMAAVVPIIRALELIHNHEAKKL